MRTTANQTTTRTLTDLNTALDRQRPVTLTYVKKNGEITVRTVEIFEIRTTKKGAIILRGMDRQSGEARTFIPTSITAYTVHRGTYQVPVPTEETPAPVPAPRTPAAYVAYEIARDERPRTRPRPTALAA
jgi:predicted DNA-binding transcriptional regulator YafY